MSTEPATLTNYPISVHSKELTTKLNSPESTLTKNIGEGVMVNQISHKKICPARPACPEPRRESRRKEHRDEGSLSKSNENMSAVAQAFRPEACFPPLRECAPALADEFCE
jgi:hypothetical protein